MAQTKQTIGIDRGPRSDRELWHFVRALWGVTIPNTQVCPHHVPPFRVFADAYFARFPVIVLKGSRGLAGKSWTLATLANTMAVGLGAQVTILGGSGAQSLNVQNAAKALWEYESAPESMLTGTPTKYDQHFANGAWIRSLMASQTSVRGPHPQRLLLDEIDEMDLDVLESAQGQPMKGKHGKQKSIETCTVMSSTHQYAMGTMTTILERARERGWPVYEVCIWAVSEVATLNGTKEIQHITTDDYVLTREGWRPVQHITYMGVKPTITVEWEDGSTLVCTPDHKIATPSGWVEAGLLQPGVSTTLTATPVPPAVGVGVLGRERVAAGAVGGEVPSTSAVDPVRDIFQMVGVDAVTHPAQMVDGVLDVAMDEPEHGTVSTLLTQIADALADDGVPVTALGEIPPPAAVLIDGRPGPEVVEVDGDLLDLTVQPIGAGLAPDALDPLGVPALAELRVVAVHNGLDLPVWDIGVHGCHEFTLASGQLISNCYRENMNPVDGWLTQDEVDRKRSEIAKVMWESEYELGEPSIEGRVLDTESVERCFDRDLGQGEVTNWTDPMIETLLADSKIAKSLLFVTGVDWAKEQDRTIISTFMVDKVSGRWTCVAWSAMSRMPWPVMVAAAEERLRKFPGGFAHDSTGLGNVIADYFDPSLRRRFNRVFADRIMGSGRSRQDLFSNYISAIENDLIRYPRLTIPYNEHRFCTWDDLFGSGHAPDSFVAGAIAWSLRKDMMGHRVPTPMGILRKSA